MHTPCAKTLAASLFVTAACLLAQPAPAQLREADVKTTIDRTPAAAPLRTAIRITAAQPAGQFLQVSVTNDSKQDITLSKLTAALPWSRPAGADDLICVGGWDMGRTEARVWPAATAEKLETGSFLLTRAPTGSAIAAFVTWKTFHSKLRWENDTLIIDADGENRLLKPGETVHLEKVWLVPTPENPNLNPQHKLPPPAAAWQDLLFAYADRIAAENNIRLNRPKTYIGWATWDYYGRTWDYEKAAANIEKLVQVSPQADFVQIDGGWWPARGDYMLVKPGLQPDGMKRLARLIRSKNLATGIHLDGMRGDSKSTVAREHPDYFLHDATGKMLVEHQINAGEPLDNTFFDYSNPAACDYIKRVMQNIRHNWGYDYIKVDFLRFGINEFIHTAVNKPAGPANAKGKTKSKTTPPAAAPTVNSKQETANSGAPGAAAPTANNEPRTANRAPSASGAAAPTANRKLETVNSSGGSAAAALIVPQNRYLTSVERFHLGMAAMREGMGADAFFLACSAVFGPTFGHVDGLRSGADINPQLSQYRKCALDNAGNFYLHGKVVYTDADYHVVRAKEDQDDTLVPANNKDGGDLTLNEAWLWTHYVALCGGPRLNSDNLLILRPERLALFNFAAAFPTADRYVPLDLWTHARNDSDPPSVILATAKGDCYLGLFNWTDANKTLTLTGLSATQLATLAKVSGDTTPRTAAGALTLALPARHSTILKLPAADFDTLRRAIEVR